MSDTEAVSPVIPRHISRRIVGTIFAAQSLFSGATILAFTLTSIIAADLAGSDKAAGLPSTLTLLSRAVLAYPFGWLLDRVGRRLGLSLGFLLGVLAVLIMAWSIINSSLAFFLIGAALLGGVRTAAEQGRYIAAEIFPTHRQASVIGWIVFAGTIGAVTGPLLVEPAANLAETRGLAANAGPYIGAALVLFLAGVVVFLFLRPDPRLLGLRLSQAEQQNSTSQHGITESKPENTSAEDGTTPVARPLRHIFSNVHALLALAAMTIGQMVMVMLMVITPLHMNRSDESTQSISLVIMAHTIGMYALSGLTGWLIGRFGRLAMITAGSLVLVASAVIAPLANSVPVLALSLFLLGLGWNFAFVAGSSLLSNQLASHERGRAQGVGEMSVAAGAGLGSLGSGLFFDAGGMLVVAATGLGFALALFALVTWVRLFRSPEVLLARRAGTNEGPA